MASLFRPTYTDKQGRQRKASKWYGQYTDADGIKRRVPLSANKTAAQQMLNSLVRKAELGKAGCGDRFEDHRKTPLVKHRDEWETSLRANGRGDEYVKLKLARLKSILDGCKFTFLTDLSADRLEVFLDGLRKDDGLSIQTRNDYLQAVKQFVRWLVENDRLDRSPFARLKGGNVKLDRRHDRRDLPPDELAKLLDATRNSSTKFRDLDGIDRFHLYLTACGTGFRVGELASLTPASFDLDEATATLAAVDTKNGSPRCNHFPPIWSRRCASTSTANRKTYPSGPEHGPTDRPICSRSTWKPPASPTSSRDRTGRFMPISIHSAIRSSRCWNGPESVRRLRKNWPGIPTFG
jgi:hypothetical protein